MNRAPLVYVDPSGHKSRKQWEDEFREAHDGQDPTEQDWWDYQFSLQISDWTSTAWGITYETRQILFGAGIVIWKGALACRAGVSYIMWTIVEVTYVGNAVSNIAAVFGNNAKHVIAGVNIVRMRDARWPLVYAGIKCPGFEAGGTIYLNDLAFRSRGAAEHTATHELGHYLQDSRHLLGEFRRARSKNYPNDFARKRGAAEDFAASFEIFVYQSIGQPVVEDGLALSVDESRQDFFLQFVR